MDFGVGFGEIMFILVIVLMLFGSDKVPEIARTLGKFMAQLKNATNEIKSEIQKGVDNISDDTTISDISSEINKAKEGFLSESTTEINKVKDDFDNLTGPIKRQL
jgi:sec-independent protein translocase protein TatA